MYSKRFLKSSRILIRDSLQQLPELYRNYKGSFREQVKRCRRLWSGPAVRCGALGLGVGPASGRPAGGQGLFLSRFIGGKMKRCNYWSLTVGTLLILTLPACDVNIASEVLSSSATDRTIHVTGSGSVTGEPDIAALDLGVSVERETVAEAREEAASAMTALINSLQANNVAEKDIKTENFSIYPQYDYTDDGRVLRGYRVKQHRAGEGPRLGNPQ